MSRRYNCEIQLDGSYSFITENLDRYLVYFYEQPLDTNGNAFSTFSIGFSKNNEHGCEPFKAKYNPKIRATITYAVNDFFIKNDHRTLFYFCYDEDGYGRHRNIVFGQWIKDLHVNVEKYSDLIIYDNNIIYASMLILKENPLKDSIVSSFNVYLEDLKAK